MKKTRIVLLALCLALLVLPVWCFAASMDTYVPDTPPVESSPSDDLGLSGAASESDLLALIQSSPATTEYYQALSNLYAGEGVGGFKVFVDGSPIDFVNYDDVQPIAQNGRTLVPLRAVTEALGAVVDWNETTQTITITLGGTTVVLKVDSNLAYVNNVPTTLDVPAATMGGRTMVPLRFVGTAFGEEVGWYPSGGMNVIALYNGG